MANYQMTDALEQSIKDLNNKVDLLAGQVGQLSEILINQAKNEEIVRGLVDDINGFGVRVGVIEKNIQKLEIKTALNTSKGDIIGRWVERLIWFVIIAALSTFNFFKSG